MVERVHMEHFLVRGCIVDIIRKKIFPGSIEINAGKIVKIEQLSLEDLRGNEKITFILPGFIDAHVHIESSLIVPSEFARLAVVHGTVATVSDPHEIANVLGLEGVRYMIQNAKSAPFKFYFGASPCVPATSFETAGATLSVDDIGKLFEENHLKYLSEMMNYPGVIHHDPTVMAKIALAKKLNRPIDGHAPGLRRRSKKIYWSWNYD